MYMADIELYMTLIILLLDHEMYMSDVKLYMTLIILLLDHEMYMSDVELYKTLPFASGMAMARGILDSLMAATYFNASG